MFQYFPGLDDAVLQVNSCCIAEDEEYLVLTVRVPKDTIRENLPMLRFLSERVGGASADECQHIKPVSLWSRLFPYRVRPAA